MRIFSGIQPTGRKHLGNYIGAIRQYVEGQDRGDPAIYCIVDLHATSVAYDPQALPGYVLDTDRDADGRRARPRALHPLPPVRRAASTPSSCWLLCSVTAYGDLKRMHQFKEKSAARARAGLAEPVPLPGAPGGGHPRLQDRRGAGGRRPAPAPRADARHRAALQRAFGEVLVVPEHRIPEVGARIMDLQDPTRKMSTTGGTEQGSSTCDDEPDAIREEDQERGDRLRAARSCAGPDKPGISNLIEILAVVRGVDPDAGRARVRRRGLRRLQGGRGRGGGRLPGARSASATRSCAPTRRRSRRARGGRRAGARAIAVGDPGRGARARWASAPPSRLARRCALASLDLDLEVFQGPFDLLLTLVLKEEVDLLEVDLAEVVLAYVEHLERAGRARPRGHHRVPGADRGAARAQVAADAAARGRGGASTRARRGGRGAARADARVPPLPRRGRVPARAARRRGRLPLPLGAAAAGSCGGCRSRWPSAVYEPGPARRGDRRPAAHAAAARPEPRGAAARLDRAAARAPARAARARGRFSFDEAVRGRRPR